MNIVQFLRIFWARRMIILIAAVCSVLGGYVVAKLVSPRYTATARVMFNMTKPDPVTGEVINARNAGAYVDSETQLLKDYRVTGHVVDAFGWETDPYLIAQYNRRPPADTRDFRRWLSQRVSDNIDTKIDGTVLEIDYKAPTAQLAKLGADTLREAFLDESLADRRSYGSKNAAWYNQQAEAARKQAEQAELAKAAYEKQNNLVWAGETDLDTARLAALAGESAAPMAAAAVPMASSSADLELAQIDAQIQQAQKELGPNHPMLRDLQAKRAIVASVVSKEQAAAKAVASGQTGAAAIQHELQAQRSKVIGERDKLERLRQLQAQVDLARDQYKHASARAAELSLEASVIDTGMTPMGVVVAPSSPSFPNKPLMVGGAGILGLGLGLSLALLLELLHRRVRGVEDLNLAPGIPCIGVVEEPFRPSSFQRLAEWARNLRPAKAGAAA